MSRREIENKIRLYKQQLQLISEYQEEFLKVMSERELYNLVDEILEKLKDAIETLKRLTNK